MSKTDGLRVEALEIGFNRPFRDPISFDVGPGEIAVVLGSNGSGKTTLLRTLAGLIPALGGEALLNGSPIQYREEMRARRAREGIISFVFQDHRLVPILTGMENILLGVPAHETEEIKPLIEELAGQLVATELLDQQPTQLSYGEQQKISLLRGLARKCSALLMDEPTASLHPRLSHNLARCLEMWSAERRVPILIATHDWPWTRRLADRFIIFDGAANHVAKSRAEAVASLLGEREDDA